jgi:galactose mutarotase-like enzyme
VICFEPMTAPANALRHSPGTVAPGESFSARFSVSVSRAA